MTAKLVDYLPELVAFTHELAIEYANQHADWDTFAKQCDAFYTDAMMQKIESIAPAWIEMASYRNRLTLYHVTGVLVALYNLPEYKQASARQQALMEWMVLFHDITKVPIQGGHDSIHGFKSAAVAGKAISKLGFSLTSGHTIDELEAWVELTYTAIKYDETYTEGIQDNSKLPQIIDGLKTLHNQDANAIVLGILFHISIVTQPDYPILAPLTDEEIKSYITADALLIIQVMYLVDNDGWSLFEEDRTAAIRWRNNTLEVFEDIKRKI